jgi:hypothetical protein
VTLVCHAFPLLQREAPSVEHDEAVQARAVRSDSEGSSDTGFARRSDGRRCDQYNVNVVAYTRDCAFSRLPRALVLQHVI